MDETAVLSDFSPRVYSRPFFPLEKHGYILEKVLNNKNRWHTKIVSSILDNDSSRYVATTYAEQDDYLKLLEITAFLRRNHKASPSIAKVYPHDNTIICEYVGDFLSDFLLCNGTDVSASLISVFDYLKDINYLNQIRKAFIMPAIISEALCLAGEIIDDFEFLPNIRTILPKLRDSDIRFVYGCGIEDPHIWNFRVEKTVDRINALTTDFDYFSREVNYYWELGYFYATFRWLKKASYLLAESAEGVILSLIEGLDLESEFMFWLGVLSSYCGYRDSLRNFMIDEDATLIQKQFQVIQELDKKVYSLANKLLARDERLINLSFFSVL